MMQAQQILIKSLVYCGHDWGGLILPTQHETSYYLYYCFSFLWLIKDLIKKLDF